MTNQDNSRLSAETQSQSTSPNPWRWVIPLVLLILIVLFLSKRRNPFTRQHGPNSPSVTWNTDYQQALQTAAQLNKPVLLAFHASWCAPCQQMKHSTYHDPAVIAISEKFVPVIIDSDTNRDLCRQYNVSGIPAYVILAPDGAVLSSFAGYRNPEQFIAQLKKYLPG